MGLALGVAGERMVACLWLGLVAESGSRVRCEVLAWLLNPRERSGCSPSMHSSPLTPPPMGKGSFKYAWVLGKLKAERKRDISTSPCGSLRPSTASPSSMPLATGTSSRT